MSVYIACARVATIAAFTLMVFFATWTIRAGDGRRDLHQQIPSHRTMEYIKELESKQAVTHLGALLNRKLPLEYLFTLERLPKHPQVDANSGLTEVENLICLYPSSSGYLTDDRVRALSAIPNVFVYTSDVKTLRIISINNHFVVTPKGKVQVRSKVQQFEYHDRDLPSSHNEKCWQLIDTVSAK